ncbi:MAG: hypothetical protein EOP62_05770 [Sphingomonadales bacterium]|nr:MAG: hypothetical protein EOP62_05770 [Sphingomonadales bacterium]
MLGASLAAILLLALTAKMMRLGGGGIASEAEAMAAADNYLSGFEATSAVLGTDQRAAIVHGRDGSVAVLKLHGAKIAARRLHAPIEATSSDEGLRIATGEARFGTVLVRGVSAL